MAGYAVHKWMAHLNVLLAANPPYGSMDRAQKNGLPK
jgi:hypothetical protein